MPAVSTSRGWCPHVGGWCPHVGEKTGRKAPRGRFLQRQKPPIDGGFRADEGTRTLDLLHGKRWRAFAPVRFRCPKRRVAARSVRARERHRSRANANCIASTSTTLARKRSLSSAATAAREFGKSRFGLISANASALRRRATIEASRAVESPSGVRRPRGSQPGGPNQTAEANLCGERPQPIFVPKGQRDDTDFPLLRYRERSLENRGRAGSSSPTSRTLRSLTESTPTRADAAADGLSLE